ncbi:GTP-binding protein HflX [Malonomonas rubra DSM 5091]|uniref:GTPase HflX n=1 Tax=Malonomonas rubra DSM 5091 TaxID=1122189 RepID=A0A1M6C5X8_MALRU|nr:GTPase HflX [Malonomonas rubra]SHI56333.1 GTP-binding protein HflX [Malonomonas rubra DSM 5091]
MIEGKTSGLKASQIHALERIYRRKIPAGELITGELARYLTELSREIQRQLGVIIDRGGVVEYVIVGDDREIVIPDLSKYSLGRSGLRGLRCIHTHLKQEPLSRDDLTDLELLRLDAIVALGVREDGLPGKIEYAHLLPDSETAKIERIGLNDFYQLDLDFSAFIQALDQEMERVAEETVDLDDGRERALLISVGRGSRQQVEDSMDELDELARTANLAVIDKVIQRPRKLNPRFLVGEGKLREIIISALQRRATLLVFDQDLTPNQVRSITEVTEIKVIDRTQLILDIFANRAQSRDGKVQVELAQLKYILPRLTGKGTAMSRLMGGIGGRGPGETKLEIDRRRIRDKIRRLEKQLDGLGRGRLQRRQKRVRAGVPIISIVGYTNAGKSTLLNAMTQSEVFTEDLLFATLDTSTRRLRFPLEREVIITDTVGFIRDLPKSLMGAFKATLEELEDADLLLHLVDLSNPRFNEQIESVDKILESLDLGTRQRLLVFNKIDQVDPADVPHLCRRYDAIPISAFDRSSFKPLLEEMQRRFWPEEDFHEEGSA